jgi:hypothetical protein
MPDRLLVASGTNRLARGFQAVPTDRMSREGAPVNALFVPCRGTTIASETDGAGLRLQRRSRLPAEVRHELRTAPSRARSSFRSTPPRRFVRRPVSTALCTAPAARGRGSSTRTPRTRGDPQCLGTTPLGRTRCTLGAGRPPRRTRATGPDGGTATASSGCTRPVCGRPSAAAGGGTWGTCWPRPPRRPPRAAPSRWLRGGAPRSCAP